MWPKKPHRRDSPLALVRLEDRTLPASTITVAVGVNGSGSLDGFLFDTTPGVITVSDGGGSGGTLSTGALAAVAVGTNISVDSQAGITFNELGGTLTLPTGPGGTVAFNSGTGPLNFANIGNTLATSGARISLTAGGGLIACNLSRGASVLLTSATGSVTGNLIQSSGQLTLSAASGITVYSQAGSVQASNSTSGNINIVQTGGPAQPLTTAGTGLRNDAPEGMLVLENLADAITVAAGSPLHSNNGAIILAGQDLNIAGTIMSGTATTNLSNFGGQPIDLGTNTAGKLGLTQAELNNVTAGILQVGSSNTGAITVSAPVSATPGWNTLAIVGSAIASAGTGSLTVGNVGLVSSGAVSLPAANSVTTLAAMSRGALTFADNIPLTIGTVNGTVGVSTSGADATIVADAVDVQQVLNVQPQLNSGTGILTLRPLSTSVSVDLGGSDSPAALGLSDAELGRITANILRVGGTVTGAVTVSSPVTRHAGYRTLSLLTGSSISQTAALGVANLAVTAPGGVVLTNAGNDVDVLAAKVTGAGQVSYTDSTGFAVGVLDGVIGVSTVSGAVTLNSGGGITGGSGGTTTNVAAPTAAVSAATSIDLNTDVNTLTAQLSGTGVIALTEAATATVNLLTAGTGVITLDGGTFLMGNNNMIGAGNTVNVAGGTLDLQGFTQSVAGVQLTGGTIAGSGTLFSATAFDVRSGTVAARLGGSASVGLIKSTAGTVTLTSANTYAGATFVNGGTLLINGTQAAGSAVNVASGGTLGGTGTVPGQVTVHTGGTLAPGAGPGILNAGNLVLAGGSNFGVDLNSPYTAAGTDYDQVNVIGPVGLNSPTLNLVGGAAVVAPGQVLTIIANDGTDPVSGTFAGLPQGGMIVHGAFASTISYTGGDGNDVTLTTVPLPPAVVQSVAIDSGVAQRSVIRSITVTFDRLVSFTGSPEAAFRLTRTGPSGATGNVTLATDFSGSTATQTVVRLTFSGALTNPWGKTTTLSDGNYTLTVFSAQIQNGVQGGDNVTSFFRLFGDINGDRAVNGLDLTAFRNSFGSEPLDPPYAPYFDFNGDGAVNGLDLTAFRMYFGVILP
ncbi:MAG TPA: dockerin type I domain-containing protein [Gemmataceae bacterium]|nr:dockerin type I domain-containing protein [Gemmataceae bacterium]